jgi:hypothetical protein
MNEKIELRILKMKELNAKIELYLNLEKFCDSAFNHDPCLNFRDCHECSVRSERERLKEEIMNSF